MSRTSFDFTIKFRFQNWASISKLKLSISKLSFNFKIKVRFQNRTSISKFWNLMKLDLDIKPRLWNWSSVLKSKLELEIETWFWYKKINVILHFIRLLLKLDFDLYHNIKTQARFTHTLFPLVSTGPQRSAAPLKLTSE